MPLIIRNQGDRQENGRRRRMTSLQLKAEKALPRGNLGKTLRKLLQRLKLIWE